MILGGIHLLTGCQYARRATAFAASLPPRFGRPPTRTPYVAQIDGLRATAIAIVLLWHISLRAARYVDTINATGPHIKTLYPYFPHGEIGVSLFFFISGYVIAEPFLSRAPSQWHAGQFYLRRLRRIYPPYFIAITGCLILVIGSSFGAGAAGVSPFRSWLASAAYLHSSLYDTSSRIDPPIWSLEVEMEFYALVPLLLWFYVRTSNPAVRQAIGWLSVGSLIVTASLVNLGHPFDPRFRFGLLAHSYLFIAGIVTADFTRIHSEFMEGESRFYDTLFTAGVVLLMAVGLYLTRVDAKPGGGWPDIITHSATLAAVLAIYAGAMLGRMSKAFLSLPWVTLTGTMCYSIYLTHIVAVEAGAHLMLHLRLHNPIAIWSVYILILAPIAFAAGLLFFIAIERPFMAPLHMNRSSFSRLYLTNRSG